MPVSNEQTEPEQTEPEPEWMRQRRLAAIFGESVPESTRDDRDEGGSRGGFDERWWREQMPPHHGKK